MLNGTIVVPLGTSRNILVVLSTMPKNFREIMSSDCLRGVRRPLDDWPEAAQFHDAKINHVKTDLFVKYSMTFRFGSVVPFN